MLKILSRILIVLLLFVIFSIPAASPSFAGNYGEHLYGSGTYGEGEPGSNLSVSGGGSSSTCTSQKPSSAPNLFQIDAKNDTVKLYFAPAGVPVTSYFVSFGDGAFSEGHGVSFNETSRKGAVSYDVFKLKHNTTYTFKVRGANGCMPGPWSATLSIRTTGSPKTVVKYYPKSQAKTSTKDTLSGVGSYITKKLPALPFTGKVKTQPKPTSSPKQTSYQPTPQGSPSFFQKILDIFR